MASVVAVDGDSLIITREVDGGKCEGGVRGAGCVRGCVRGV